ncbi:MAG: hypothetical protein GX234_09590 [Clostridiales bacterium]|nr:hypothetical protein [Clostridiales bacterium]
MAEATEKEDRQTKKRLIELAEKSYKENRFTFSGFLGMAETSLLYGAMAEYGSSAFTLWGGYEDSERQIVRFGDPTELGYEEDFPVVCIRIIPLLKKFADELSHRDFLGALMNLGIERDTLGDILVKEREGYVFVHEKMADFICENLTRVRHTSMRCERCEELAEVLKKEPVDKSIVTASSRADSILAKVYQLSRSQSLLLFQEKKVYVNGRLFENNSGILKEGDVVAVRGHGKFIYRGVQYQNKKGKFCIQIGVYV